MEDFIRRVLERRNAYKVELDLYQALQTNMPDTVKDKGKEIQILELKLTVIDGWNCLLNENEKFIVKHHLIDGISWPGVVTAYREKWGFVLAKTERMLKIYQANALEKIAAFTQAHMDVIGYLFSDLIDDNSNDGSDDMKQAT
jgi:hypothetical protein